MKLAFLRPLYDSFGGYVSAYLDIFRAREDAAEAIGLRWLAVRQRLADSGADPGTLDAVGNVITEPANAVPDGGIAATLRY